MAMKMNKEVSWRHEYKYVCNALQLQILKSRAEGLLSRDSHTNPDGTYRIRSLYFDDSYHTCYNDNENGTDLRAKYRIRIYNEDKGYIALEKKSKRHGMTHKAAGRIDEELCRRLMAGEFPELPKMADNEDETLRSLLLQMQLKNLKPVVIVDYERTPFTEMNGNVRITFDECLASSGDIEGFLSKDIRNRPIFPPGKGLVEVKWDSHLPEHIRKILELDSLKWTTFSKYYICRKLNDNGGILL